MFLAVVTAAELARHKYKVLGEARGKKTRTSARPVRIPSLTMFTIKTWCATATKLGTHSSPNTSHTIYLRRFFEYTWLSKDSPTAGSQDRRGDRIEAALLSEKLSILNLSLCCPSFAIWFQVDMVDPIKM